MRKFRIITDNLDWVGIPKGSTIEEIGPKVYAFYTNKDIPSMIGSKEMSYALMLRPEWFSEIKEDESANNPLKALYTEKDMLSFGINVEREHKTRNRPCPVETLLSEYKAAKFSPKEEPKETCTFTTADMVDFGRYVYELIKQPVPTIDIHTLDRWVHNLDLVIKKNSHG